MVVSMSCGTTAGSSKQRQDAKRRSRPGAKSGGKELGFRAGNVLTADSGSGTEGGGRVAQGSAIHLFTTNWVAQQKSCFTSTT